ncbi:MAG: zeta toxin family protein [Dehalococcoidia bacterium]
MPERKTVVVLAGPNGAGKTTTAGGLLLDLGVTEFVNADIIEREITTPEDGPQQFAAGRLMLSRIDELALRGESFAFETTLASRTFVPMLRGLMANSYESHLVYVWLRSPDMAIDRVAARVTLGGHHVPSDVIRRRYQRGLKNFFTLYQPLVDSWRVYDNSGR